MKVLVAGATGVIGHQLVPLLEAVGHDVVALVRPGGEDRHAGTQVASPTRSTGRACGGRCGRRRPTQWSTCSPPSPGPSTRAT